MLSQEDMFGEMIKDVLKYLASELLTVVYAHNGLNFDIFIFIRDR